MRRFLCSVGLVAAGFLAFPFLFLAARETYSAATHRPVQRAHVAVEADEPVISVDIEVPEAVPQSEVVAEGPRAVLTQESEDVFLAPGAEVAVEAEVIEQNPVPQFRIVLPARPEMLATPTFNDEVEIAKLAELREKLKQTVEAKAALLSAEALEAEIEMHQRHHAELQALAELQKLQQSLQELGEKFPDSNAGRKAKEVLNLLKRPPADIRLQPLPDERMSPRKPSSPTY